MPPVKLCVPSLVGATAVDDPTRGPWPTPLNRPCERGSITSTVALKRPSGA
jgi:hypothetical protein